MKTKHTQGTWKPNPISGYEREVRVINQDGSKKLICLANSNPSFKTGEAEANAKLIAAAPDLLQVLIEIQFMIDAERPVILSEMENKIKSAIKKATL